MHDQPIDVVYTWVDDSWPGYLDLLNRYATTPHDRNPNRTRDNLELLKYSLRSLERCLPWVRNVYLVSMRPQLPSWLDPAAAGLVIAHHDTFMPAACLPTFNSFAIVSCLHRLPQLSRRFIYVEDDMLFGAPVTLDDFVTPDGLFRYYPKRSYATDAALRDRDDQSPWDASLAWCSHLLDQRFGQRRRPSVNHVPLLCDRELLGEMAAWWPEAYAEARRSCFRGPRQAIPEYLFPWVMIQSGAGRLEALATTRRRVVYQPLENILPWAWYGALRIALRRPRFITFNDNFGATPHAGVVRWMRGYLERRYPARSRFERAS